MAGRNSQVRPPTGHQAVPFDAGTPVDAAKCSLEWAWPEARCRQRRRQKDGHAAVQFAGVELHGGALLTLSERVRRIPGAGSGMLGDVGVGLRYLPPGSSCLQFSTLASPPASDRLPQNVQTDRHHDADHSGASAQHEPAVVRGGPQSALNYRGRCM